jgi:hypothetical protein
LEIHVYVAQVDTGWTPKDAENQMDLIHSEIVGLVRAQAGHTNPDWLSLVFTDRTVEEGPLKIGAMVYLHEMFPLVATVNDGIGRQQVREAIAALLRGGLSYNKFVYEYQVTDFQKNSPVIFVAGAGSDARGGTFGR